MTDKELNEIAEKADMIVSGYAFTKVDGNISVLNLSHPSSAMLLSKDGTMLETNMCPVEQSIVLKYWENNSMFMEDEIA